MESVKPMRPSLALDVSGLALGAGLLVSGFAAHPHNLVAVVFGSLVIATAGFGRVVALVAAAPARSDGPMTVRRVLATYRWYANRSLGRAIIVGVGGLWIASNTVKLVRSIAEMKWTWAASYGAMEIFLIAISVHEGMRLERRALEAQKPEPASTVADSVWAAAVPTAEGWILEDGRWRCVAHNTRYCKICSAVTRSDPSSSE